MQTHETACNLRLVVPVVKAASKAAQQSRFIIVKDSRNRKVRGLWRRGERLYMQTRVSGEKSARRIPLKATTLEEAKAEMAEIRKEKRFNGLPSPGLRPLLSDYAEQYLAHHTNAADSGKKPRTIAREKESLNQWKKAIGNVRLDKIGTQMIAAFTKGRIEAGCKPRTANLDVIVLRNVLKDALEAGLLSKLPTDGIKPRKVKAPVRRLLTPAEFATLCKAAESCGKNGVQLLDYLRLLAFSGGRRNEVLALRWEAVDFGRKLLCIGADGLSKNSEARFVNFNPDLETHLRSMQSRRAPDTQWLFPSPQRGQADTPAHTFKESFSIARTKAQLGWVKLHDLRHYFISLAVMAGIDFLTIASWVGHKDGGVLIGKVYGHLLPEHRERMATRLVFSPAIVAFPETACSAR
jgi:integrase